MILGMTNIIPIAVSMNFHQEYGEDPVREVREGEQLFGHLRKALMI